MDSRKDRIYPDTHRVYGYRLGCMLFRLFTGGALMRSEVIKCSRFKCFGNTNGICRILAKPVTGKCTFYKSRERREAELTALSTDDMRAYRNAKALD